MKNLYYKEIKLCLTPVVWLFIILFPFIALIPSYPVFIPYIYVLAVYPFIFLGANKGQASNDLLYSVLLPIRRKDIVVGRMLLLTTIQIVSMILAAAISPLSVFLGTNKEGQITTPGLSAASIVAILGFVIVAFAIFDMIFFAFYYKKGKSILAPTIIGMLVFIIFLGVLTLALPLAIPEYASFFKNLNIGYQFLILLGGCVVAAIIKFITVKIGAKKFENADF